jgi:hypothetical protein
MADNTDRRLNDVSDEDIERLYNVILRGLARRRARLDGRSPKAVEQLPAADDTAVNHEINSSRH